MGKGKYTTFLLFLLGLTLLTLSVTLFVTVMLRSPDAVPVSGKTQKTEQVEPKTDAERRKDFYTMLIAGTDLDGTRTDTIMLASLDTNTGEVNVMSIPRDTRSYMESGKVHKLNAAHNKGIERMLTEIENTIGFVPDHYMVINYSVFETVIDAVGGVTVNVPMNMDYSDPSQDLEIHIKAGEQVLDGKNALHYMRFRSGYPDADLGRIRAQQVLLKSLAHKLKTPAALGLLTKIPEIMEDVETNLTTKEILWLATKVFAVDLDALTVETLPGYAVAADYAVDEEDALALINDKFNPYEKPIEALNIP